MRGQSGGAAGEPAVVAVPARAGGSLSTLPGRAVMGLDRSVVALLIGSCIVAVVAIGSVQQFADNGTVAGVRVRGFDLDGEANVPSAFSAGLVGIAVILAGMLAGVLRAEPDSRRVVLGFAALLLFVGVDELVRIHERLAAWTGVRWQLLYLPVGLVGAALFVLLWRRLRQYEPGGWLVIAAAAAWILSQLFELWQRTESHRLVHPWMIPAEEGLEMTGATLLLLAFLTALQARPGHGHEVDRPGAARTGE